MRKENKAADLRFSFDKDALPPSCFHRSSPGYFFKDQADRKESGGAAALVPLGCTGEQESVEEEGRFSQMPFR